MEPKVSFKRPEKKNRHDNRGETGEVERADLEKGT